MCEYMYIYIYMYCDLYCSSLCISWEATRGKLTKPSGRAGIAHVLSSPPYDAVESLVGIFCHQFPSCPMRAVSRCMNINLRAVSSQR